MWLCICYTLSALMDLTKSVFFQFSPIHSSKCSMSSSIGDKKNAAKTRIHIQAKMRWKRIKRYTTVFLHLISFSWRWLLLLTCCHSLHSLCSSAHLAAIFLLHSMSSALFTCCLSFSFTNILLVRYISVIWSLFFCLYNIYMLLRA